MRKKQIKKLSRCRTPYSVKFAHTGSTVLDQALGGGWALGRIINIVGDRSTGKTLLAIELCAVAFLTGLFRKISGKTKVRIVYDLAEGSMDFDLRKMYNLARSRIEWRYSDTVEEYDKNVSEELEKVDADTVLVYILDSLDSLTSDAEKKFDAKKHKRMDGDEEIGKNGKSKKGKGTYGVDKATLMNRFFRRNALTISRKEVLFIIISQTRVNIGVKFGPLKKRSCADALDFYEAQEVWLSETQKIIKKVGKKTRVVGIRLRAMVRKLKVGLPYRTADLILLFDFGLDNVGGNIDFLYDLVDGWGREKKVKRGESKKKLEWDGEMFSRERLIDFIEEGGLEKVLEREVVEEWARIEREVEHGRKRKYS